LPSTYTAILLKKFLLKIGIFLPFLKSGQNFVMKKWHKFCYQKVTKNLPSKISQNFAIKNWGKIVIQNWEKNFHPELVNIKIGEKFAIKNRRKIALKINK